MCALIRLTDGGNHSFHSLSMLAYNGAGAGLCCGTGYIVLREALDSIDGWDTDCSVEDVTTSLALNNQVWDEVAYHSMCNVVSAMCMVTRAGKWPVSHVSWADNAPLASGYRTVQHPVSA